MSLRTQGQRQIFTFDIDKKKMITGKIVNPVLTLIIAIASFSFYKPSVFRCFVQNLLRTIIYGKRLMWNWELSLREQASTRIKSIYRNLLSVHLTFFLFFYLLFEILHWCSCCAANKEEKSLRHCNLGSKIFG